MENSELAHCKHRQVKGTDRPEDHKVGEYRVVASRVPHLYVRNDDHHPVDVRSSYPER